MDQPTRVCPSGGGKDGYIITDHHDLQRAALQKDREFRAQEEARSNPAWLPIYTEVWAKQPKLRPERFQEFLAKTIPFEGARADPVWARASESISELDRRFWSVAVRNRFDVFHG